jgi:hypothetical protein
MRRRVWDLVARRRDGGDPARRKALCDNWGVGECSSCGATILLGEETLSPIAGICVECASLPASQETTAWPAGLEAVFEFEAASEPPGTDHDGLREAA